jgi:hypothetical protein
MTATVGSRAVAGSRPALSLANGFNVQEFKVTKQRVAQIVRDVSIVEGENPE